MRVAPAVELSPEQRATLEARTRARRASARSVERARIILLAADGWQNREIARRLQTTPAKVARWRARFLMQGLAALERDAPRPGRPRVITAARVREVVRNTTQEPPPNATHWSTRTMAAATGLSEKSIRRIWQQHGLKPHLLRTFKLSRDPLSRSRCSVRVAVTVNAADRPAGCSTSSRPRPGVPGARK